MSRTGWVALGLALACGLLWIASGTAQEEAAPAGRPMRIAVVDMAAVLRGSKQWRDAAEERLRLMERMRRTISKLSQQVQVLRNEYENLPPGTDERRRKQQEISGALEELQQTRSDFETRIAENHNQAARELFRRITEAVSAHAEQHDLDLVLKKQSLDLAGEQTVEQSLLLATTEVLYAEPSLEISDEIVERINAHYPGPIEAK